MNKPKERQTGPRTEIIIGSIVTLLCLVLAIGLLFRLIPNPGESEFGHWADIVIALLLAIVFPWLTYRRYQRRVREQQRLGSDH